MPAPVRSPAAATMLLCALGCGASCPPWTFAPLEPEVALVGERAPTRVLAADPARRWAVIAQARSDSDGDGRIAVRSWEGRGVRSGDPLSSWLVEGNGPGRPIDAWIGSDEGRWLAFVERGELVLRDADAGTDRALGPTTAPVGAFAEGHFVGRAGERSLVVVPLDGGSATTLELDGRIWALETYPGSSFVVVSLLDESTDPYSLALDGEGDGTCTRLHASRCEGPAERFVAIHVSAPEPRPVSGELPSPAAWGVTFEAVDGSVAVLRAGGEIHRRDAPCLGAERFDPALHTEAVLVRCTGHGAHVLDDEEPSAWIVSFDDRPALEIAGVGAAPERTTFPASESLELFGMLLVDVSAAEVVEQAVRGEVVAGEVRLYGWEHDRVHVLRDGVWSHYVTGAGCGGFFEHRGPIGTCARAPEGLYVAWFGADGSALLRRAPKSGPLGGDDRCGDAPTELFWGTVELVPPVPITARP